jgi:hypothetical protein
MYEINFKVIYMTNNKYISSKLFNDRESVEAEYNHLVENGYSPDEINFLMNDQTRNKHFMDSPEVIEMGNKSVKGLAAGGVTGGIIGGVSAAIAAIGTALVLPGLGLIIAGPLAAGIAGLGAGSVAGGLMGALVGWGIPEAKVKEYEEGINKGGVLMAVQSKDENSYTQLNNRWNQ